MTPACVLLLALAAPHVAETGVPARLVAAVSYVEARCDLDTPPGGHGEVGPFQVLPSHVRNRVLVRHCGGDLRLTRVNVCWGVHLLRKAYTRAHGDWRQALRHFYNGHGDPAYWQKIRRALVSQW